MKKELDTGGPAFPQGESYDTFDLAGNRHDHTKAALKPGMTLLDWFAGQALQGLIVADPKIKPDERALYAYSQARAMLAERKRLSEGS